MFYVLALSSMLSSDRSNDKLQEIILIYTVTISFGFHLITMALSKLETYTCDKKIEKTISFQNTTISTP